jgi:hypothetical protein
MAWFLAFQLLLGQCIWVVAKSSFLLEVEPKAAVAAPDPGLIPAVFSVGGSRWEQEPHILCWDFLQWDPNTGKATPLGLDYEHMIKARAHKGGVRIGMTPKKLASICCP